MLNFSMASYYLKLALINFKRAPSLYGLTLFTLSLGVGLVCANFALISVMSGDPIPQKSDRLIHVSLNTWPNETPHEEPFHVLRYRDAMQIEQADMVKRSAVFFASGVYARDADSASLERVSATVRATTHGLFALADAPFAFGRPFEQNHGNVVVIGDSLNDQIFGGGDNVGKTLELSGELFTIVGILKPWHLRPLFYHATENRAFLNTEDIFVPLETAIDLNWQIHARSSSVGQIGDLADARIKDRYYLQVWAELDNKKDRGQLQQFWDNYSQGLKDAGEHPLAIRNELHDVNEWLKKQNVVDQRVLAFGIATALFLVVCVFNASSLLLSRFHAGKFEVGLRRSIGASKRQIFIQGLFESTLLGAAASLVALAISVVFLYYSVQVLPDLANIAVLNGETLIAGVILSIVTANISSLYSLYRANRYSISAELK